MNFYSVATGPYNTPPTTDCKDASILWSWTTSWRGPIVRRVLIKVGYRLIVILIKERMVSVYGGTVSAASRHITCRRTYKIPTGNRQCFVRAKSIKQNMIARQFHDFLGYENVQPSRLFSQIPCSPSIGIVVKRLSFAKRLDDVIAYVC